VLVAPDMHWFQRTRRSQRSSSGARSALGALAPAHSALAAHFFQRLHFSSAFTPVPSPAEGAVTPISFPRQSPVPGPAAGTPPHPKLLPPSRPPPNQTRQPTLAKLPKSVTPLPHRGTSRVCKEEWSRELGSTKKTRDSILGDCYSDRPPPANAASGALAHAGAPSSNCPRADLVY
jgi:hypothetical protein